MHSLSAGDQRSIRLQLILVGVVLTANAGCIQQSSSPPDPREGATKLYETHMRADHAFASLEAPDDCPTHFVTYGTNKAPSEVNAYFEGQDLEERRGVANDLGNRPVWTGERIDAGVPTEQVDVWTGPDGGHTEWKTVFAITTARCELAASARYSVEPQEMTSGTVVKAELVNTGDLALTYGLDYQIQRLEAGRWRRVPFGTDDGIPCGVPSIGLTLSPGRSDKHDVSFCDDERLFEPGVYRVVKTVGFETYKEETLRAQFTVRP